MVRKLMQLFLFLLEPQMHLPRQALRVGLKHSVAGHFLHMPRIRVCDSIHISGRSIDPVVTRYEMPS